MKSGNQSKLETKKTRVNWKLGNQSKLKTENQSILKLKTRVTWKPGNRLI